MNRPLKVLLVVWLFFLIMPFGCYAGDALSYFYEGTKYLSQGQPQKAIEALSKAIGVDSKYAYAYVNRGLAYYELEEQEKAQADFLKALKIDPNDETANNNLGILYFEMMEYDRALFYFEHALRLSKPQSPRRAAIYRNLSFVYKQLVDIEQSKEAENKAQEIFRLYSEMTKSHNTNSQEHLWAARRFGNKSDQCRLVLKIYEQN